MKPLHIETPFFESQALTVQAGRSIWLKLEALQPPGSFKIRGIGLACQEYRRRGANRFISSSGGNAGIAVAYAGRHLAVPVIVVVPETTTERARHLIEQEGAEVIVHGTSWQEANGLALSMLEDSDAFLHPFDDPLLWHGHATLIDEIARTGKKPEAIVLSVGGGGLLSGVIEGLHRNNWRDIPVIAVETDGADSFARSVSAGRLVELPAITSIATSLGARQVSENAFSWSGKHPVRSVVVSDKAAVAACVKFTSDQRIVTEPACGASLATVYERVEEIKDYTTIAIIVCGGGTTSIEELRQFAQSSDVDPVNYHGG